MTGLWQIIPAQSNLGTLSDFDADNRYVYGGSLVYSPPLDGLRLGVSYFTGQTDFDFKLGNRDGDARGTNKDFVVLSTEYSRPDWKIAAEYSKFTGNREVLGIDVQDGRSQGAYAQLCYHLFEWLKSSVLESDTVARLGGDEFAVILDNLSEPHDAVNTAKRILAAFAEPVIYGGKEIFSSPSIGIALYPSDAENTVELLKNADIAMYHVKQRGGNGYGFFSGKSN